MRDRHVPRLCSSCGAPMARQEELCWKCGADWLPETQPPRTPEPNDNDLGTVPGPTHRRTISFARWLAALAGTGGLIFAQPVCGSPCESSVGALRGWLASCR